MQIEFDIKNFILDDNQHELKLPYTEPRKIYSILEAFGYVDKYGADTNGWELDFWVYFGKPGSRDIKFTGSWYYGNYYLTKLDETEEEDE